MEQDAALEAVFMPVQPPTTFEETVERLGTAIRLGLLAPGSRLPPERELAPRLRLPPPAGAPAPPSPGDLPLDPAPGAPHAGPERPPGQPPRPQGRPLRRRRAAA